MLNFGGDRHIYYIPRMHPFLRYSHNSQVVKRYVFILELAGAVYLGAVLPYGSRLCVILLYMFAGVMAVAFLVVGAEHR